MTITIDRERAVQLLEQAVAQRGEDYVYPARETAPTCLYWHGEEPGCIVGLALHFAGVPDEVVASLDYAEDDGTIESEAIAAILTASDIAIADDAARLFGVAQGYQDTGSAWGLAVRRAKGVFA